MLAVVVFHAVPTALPGGFTGVDVFFVISGYLITHDIVERQQAGTFTLLDFYVRRVRRIFPALLTVLLAVWAFGAVVLYRPEFEQLSAHTLASAVFSQNFQLLGEAGYFDTDAARKPLLHLWSLAIEEQFYLLWPLALLLVRRALWLAGAVLALSFAANIVLGDAAYFLPVSRFWQIMAGAALALSGLREARLAWPGALLVVGSLAFVTEHGYPGWQALAPTVGAVLLIASGPAGAVASALSAKPLVTVGLVSYSLYLWHWPALAFLRILAPEPNALAIGAALAIAAGLSALTYRYIEQPLRRARSQRWLAGAMASVAGAAVVVAAIGDPRPGDRWDAYAARIADLEPAKAPLPPCDASLRSAAPRLTRCVQSGEPTAALIGDSHADHLVDALSAQPGWLMATQNGCPPVLGTRAQMMRTDCADSAERLIGHLAARDDIGTVVLAFYGGYAETTNFAADHIASARGPAQITLNGSFDGKAQTMEAGLDRTVSTLIAAGKRVAVVLDVPELPFLPRDCIGRPLQLRRPACEINRAEVLERQTSMRRIVERVSQRHRGLQVIDSLDALCSETCSATRGDVLVYRDSHHLSRRGSEPVAELLSGMIDRQHARGISPASQP